MHQVLITHTHTLLLIETWNLGASKNCFKVFDFGLATKCQTHMKGMFDHHFDISKISNFNLTKAAAFFRSKIQTQTISSCRSFVKLLRASQVPKDWVAAVQNSSHGVVTFKSNPWIPIPTIEEFEIGHLGWHPLRYQLPNNGHSDIDVVELWAPRPGWCAKQVRFWIFQKLSPSEISKHQDSLTE